MCSGMIKYRLSINALRAYTCRHQQHGRCGREFAMTKRCEKGQALLVTALTLTVLMLAAGLAIDMGYLRYQRRRMQTAVDSAAIAGASALLTTTDISDASTAAVNDAGLNGYSGFLDTQVVSCPDSSPYCVQVRATEVAPLFFMRILPNTSSVTISTVAVAEKSSQGCIYALGNGGGAITIGYSYHTIVAAPDCNIVDNGALNIENAISHTLFASTIVDNAYNGNGTVSPTPVTSSSIQGGDPLAYVAAPGGPACALRQDPLSRIPRINSHTRAVSTLIPEMLQLIL